MNRCLLCSIKIEGDGPFGPDCQKHYDGALQLIGIDRAEIELLAQVESPAVTTWLSRIRSAVVRGLKSRGQERFRCYRDARGFVEQARKGAMLVSLKEAA